LDFLVSDLKGKGGAPQTVAQGAEGEMMAAELFRVRFVKEALNIAFGSISILERAAASESTAVMPLSRLVGGGALELLLSEEGEAGVVDTAPMSRHVQRGGIGGGCNGCVGFGSGCSEALLPVV
jgi:hypothetical protein